MERILKFRVWDKVNEDYCHLKRFGLELSGQITDTNLDKWSAETGWVRYWDNNRFHIMQFTGHKDKNGKEIYEGDIVNLYCCGHKGVLATIVWNNDSNPCFRPEIHDKKLLVKHGSEQGKNVSMAEAHSWAGSHYCFALPRYMAVIGNIHENPELI